MPDLPLPIAYRTGAIQPVIRSLCAGESCALVGVGSSGKSNIARHLLRADVRLYYLGERAAQAVFLYTNCKPFAHRAPHDLYLEALDRLSQALEELDGPAPRAALPGEVAGLWKEASAAPELLARRNLDLALGRAVRAGVEHLIIMLDDCDDLFTSCPPVLFSDLRALRDNHKPRLVYLTLSRREPVFLRTGVHEYEELFELISPAGHTHPVPPYDEADGLFMLRRLAARPDPPRQLSDAAARRLYELGGGHAGLMRALFFAAPTEAEVLAPGAVERLAAHPDIRAECRKVLDSLEEQERADLGRIAAGQPPTSGGLRRLVRRGLARERFSRPPELFSPVFERALSAARPPAEPGSDERPATPAGTPARVEFTGVGPGVRVEGRLVTSLTPPEYEILRCLAERGPRPCSRAELIVPMLQGEGGSAAREASGSPPRRLEHYLERLRRKLGLEGQYIRVEGDSVWLT